MTFKTAFVLLALFLPVLFGAAPVSAGVIGQIVSAEPGAQVASQGRKVTASEGLAIHEGDVITTDDSGRALVLFSDETRIAVGPRSRLEITQVLMRGDATASRFAVNALGGTFRFLSGNSPKDSYRIKTPTATMGVRGTEFDFFVDRATGANVALFSGEVVLCPKGGSCALVRGRCTLALSDTAGAVGTAATRKEKRTILGRDFPFVVEQANLPESFRAPTRSCGAISPVVVVKSARVVLPVTVGPKPQEPVKNEPPKSPPPPPPPPPPGPDVTPDTGPFPGQSGTTTPNAGRGNATSQGQHGTGTGKGQGEAHRSEGRSKTARSG